MIALFPNCGFLSETSRMLAIARALQARGEPVAMATHGGPFMRVLESAGMPVRQRRPERPPPQRRPSAPSRGLPLDQRQLELERHAVAQAFDLHLGARLRALDCDRAERDHLAEEVAVAA